MHTLAVGGQGFCNPYWIRGHTNVLKYTRSHDTLDPKSEKNPANQLYIITKFLPRQVKKYDVIVFKATTFGLRTFFFFFFLLETKSNVNRPTLSLTFGGRI